MNTSSSTTPQPDFLFTYGTGGIECAENLQVITLPRFHAILLNKHQTKTEELYELWEPLTCAACWEEKQRLRQQKRVEATFPFVVPQAAYNAALVEEAYANGFIPWRRKSKLVAIALQYAIGETAQRSAKNRKRLEKQLLGMPLLGSSIVLMYRIPGQCTLVVFVASGTYGLYHGRKRVIERYIKLVNPALYKKLVYQMAWGTDTIPCDKYMVGFDPQAYLRPQPMDGYVDFPSHEASAACYKANIY